MTKIRIPTEFMGVDSKEAYDRVINAKTQESISNSTGRNAGNIEGMIPIPGTNLYFAKERSHLNVNWNDTHGLLASENKRMPTVPEFISALKYFKSSKDNELQNLYNEITELRDPWRANHLDAYFEKRKDGFYILTNNKTKKEKLESCLMEDKTPGINLDSWLSDSTSQGLPNSKISNGDLYYWHPRDKTVARFDADSDRADLNGDRVPSYSNPVLGVFAVAQGV